MVDGVCAFRIFAHHKSRVSQLAVRDFGDDCGIILWVDVAENWFHLRLGIGACRRGCGVAFLLQDTVSDRLLKGLGTNTKEPFFRG